MNTHTRNSASAKDWKTIVTLTRGFGIGQYEVTQGECLSIMHTNPSQVSGDLGRPISNVNWPDATNYVHTLDRT